MLLFEHIELVSLFTLVICVLAACVLESTLRGRGELDGGNRGNVLYGAFNDATPPLLESACETVQIYHVSHLRWQVEEWKVATVGR